MFWEQGHLMYATGASFFQLNIKPLIREQSDQSRVEERAAALRRMRAYLMR